MRLYSLLAHVEKLTVSEPFGGIAKASYRYSLDYIPATQIYGLILKSIIMDKLTPSEEVDKANTLNVLDHLLDYERKVIEVNPMIVYDQIYSRKILETLSKYIDEIDDNIYRILRQPSILNGLVEIPKPIRKRYGLKCSFIPLGLLPFLGLILLDKEIIDKINSICNGYSVSIARRLRAGIVIDRVRKSSLPGLFYAYQYSIPAIKNYITTISIEYDLERIKELIEFLGIGYKKSVNKSFGKIFINRLSLGKWISVRETLHYFTKIVAEAIINKYHSIGLIIYAFDNTLFPIVADNDKLLFLWINGSPKVYLEITNTFYNVLSARLGSIRVHVCKKGSYALLKYTDPRDLLDDIDAIHDLFRIDKSIIRVSKVINGRVYKLSSIEHNLVFNKLIKSMINLILIPIPMG